MPRWPTGPFSHHRTGCYGCVRKSPADGGCGIGSYPCTHYGSDLFANLPEVVAPESGVVVAVADGKSPPWMGYGPAIIMIKGDGGKYLLLAHLAMSTIGVNVGDRVTEGENIANYDQQYGHTHFEVRHAMTGPSKTNTMDPAVWISGGGSTSTVKNLLLFGFVVWGGWKLLGERRGSRR